MGDAAGCKAGETQADNRPRINVITKDWHVVALIGLMDRKGLLLKIVSLLDSTYTMHPLYRGATPVNTLVARLSLGLSQILARGALVVRAPPG
jgi:hypothetical protein